MNPIYNWVIYNPITKDSLTSWLNHIRRMKYIEILLFAIGDGSLKNKQYNGMG